MARGLDYSRRMGGVAQRLGCALWLALCAQACTSAGDDASATPEPQGGQGALGGAGGTGGSGGVAGAMGGVIDAGGTGGGGSAPLDAGAARDGAMGSPDGATASAECVPRSVAGTAEVHFHHVHFNTVDPEADLAFFETFFGAPPVTFCSDAQGQPLTRATRTERGWFLYTKVDAAPDPALNTYLEHVGWVSQTPSDDLARMVGLGITLYPEGRAQCAQAASGTAPCPIAGLSDAYYYYVQAPSGARVEVALGPGPATSGFGHVHFIMGEDLSFFATVSDGAFADNAIDGVNHIDAALMESILQAEMVVDTRGKPIDHIAYSTTDLEAARARIEAAGIAIAQDISWKPEYGFRSFFVRTEKGTWLELVEDSRFE